jgi:hypothetical protein
MGLAVIVSGSRIALFVCDKKLGPTIHRAATPDCEKGENNESESSSIFEHRHPRLNGVHGEG